MEAMNVRVVSDVFENQGNYLQHVYECILCVLQGREKFLLRKWATAPNSLAIQETPRVGLLKKTLNYY